MPNNIVVQGNHLALIDFADPNGTGSKTVHTPAMLNLMISLAKELAIKQVPLIFKNILRYCRQQLQSQ